MAKASRYNNLLESYHQKIVKALDVDSLLPILCAKGLLLTSERDQLITNIETNKDKAEFVYSILSQKGPYYFNQFIGALREDYQERHRELANILALEQNEINCDGLGVSTDQGLLTPVRIILYPCSYKIRNAKFLVAKPLYFIWCLIAFSVRTLILNAIYNVL